MSDRIRVEGIEFHGFHGVSEQEREIGHRFRVDVEMELDLRPAGLADDVNLTVDYGSVARLIAEIGTGASVRLVETLAERMASRLLEEFPPVEALELYVAKLQPPFPVPFAASIIHIRRTR